MITHHHNSVSVTTEDVAYTGYVPELNIQVMRSEVYLYLGGQHVAIASEDWADILVYVATRQALFAHERAGKATPEQHASEDMLNAALSAGVAHRASEEAISRAYDNGRRDERNGCGTDS